MAAPPTWLEVHPIVGPPDAGLAMLEAGEQEAIVLAQELQADIVLVTAASVLPQPHPPSIPRWRPGQTSLTPPLQRPPNARQEHVAILSARDLPRTR